MSIYQKCGANLTVRLLEERKELLEIYANKRKSVSLLFEAAPATKLLETKIEVAQLNEILYPYYLFNKATGNDLYTRIVRQTIAELHEQGYVAENSILLSEGFWDAVQAGVGNFAGGIDKVLKKVKLKKEPEGWEQAQRVFTKIAEKEGNKVVQDLIKAIEGEAEELETGLGSKPKDQKFPVNKNANVFFSGVNTIASVYDTIVAATEKDAGEEGFLPIEVANEIIEQLRIVVQKYMADTEREKGGMYASFGGGDAAEGGIKDDAHGMSSDMVEADEDDDDDLLQEKDWEAETAKLDDDEKDGADTGEEIDPDEEFEKIMRGQDSPVFQRMTSLKAPMVIAGTGAALGAMGWVANQPWFHDWVLEILDIPKTTEIAGKPKIVMQTMSEKMTEMNPSVEDLGNIEAGKGGLAQQTSRLLGLDSGTNLMGSDASLGDLKNAALKAGGGDLDQGLKNIAELTRGRGKPDQAYEWMKKAISDPSSVGADGVDTEGSLWKLFAGGTRRGGGIASHAMPGKGIFSVGIGNTLKKQILKQVTNTITKQVPRKIAGAAIKTGTASAASAVAAMTGAAPILAGIGLSTVVAGATLALIRQRAKKQSRMGTFNTLLQALKTLQPKPPENPIVPDPEGESDVTITLYDAEAPATESLAYAFNLMSERTEVEVTGLEGDKELEQTGGMARFSLDPVSPDVPPDVTKASQIPYVMQGIADRLPDLDLKSKNVKVKIVDKRTTEEIPEVPPTGETPPVKVDPAAIAKGDNAVVVFDNDGAKVWRILKKRTFKAYAADAKRSGDKDAPEFADRAARYDAILAKLKADGVFVNSDGLEAELSKISSGVDGDQYRVSYTRTRKGKKRKSSTGGYTEAGAVTNIGDVRKNIKGAPGAPKPKNQSGMTVIYLVGSNVIRALTSAGMDEDDAKNIASKAISIWADSGKRPKIADLGVKDKSAAAALKNASLAEAFGFRKHRYAVVDVTPSFLKRVILEVKELQNSDNRLLKLAGLR